MLRWLLRWYVRRELKKIREARLYLSPEVEERIAWLRKLERELTNGEG